MIDDQRKYAEHEAAHCLTAWYYGLTIHYVTIQGPIMQKGQESQTPFYCRIESPIIDADHMVPGFMAEIICDMAGAAIEMQKTGVLSYGALADIQKAMRRLSSDDPHIRQMAEDTRKILSHGQDWKTAAQAFFEKHGHRAGEVLETDQAQRAIDALAGCLLEHGCLSGFDAVRVIETAWGSPLPEKAKPAADHPTGLSSEGSLENVLESVGRLQKMALEILHGYRPKSETEEKVTSDAIVKVLDNIFSFSGFSGALNKELGQKVPKKSQYTETIIKNERSTDHV